MLGHHRRSLVGVGWLGLHILLLAWRQLLLLKLRLQDHLLALSVGNIWVTLLHRWIIGKVVLSGIHRWCLNLILNYASWLGPLVILNDIWRTHFNLDSVIHLSPCSIVFKLHTKVTTSLLRSFDIELVIWRINFLTLMMLLLTVSSILICDNHLIHPVDLALHVFALPILPFLFIDHVRTVCLQLNKSLSQLFVLASQSI